MNIAIISITEKGRLLSQKLWDFLAENHSVRRYCFAKHSDENAISFSDVHLLTASVFSECEALIFICACGIAVRSIAAHLCSKETDPAVIVLDDCGTFAVPILSGHLGGANRLAEVIAEKTEAVPVVTTATDMGRKFSPDSFAKANALLIHDLKAAKEIAAAVLSGEKIGLLSDYPCENLPPEIAEDLTCRTGIRISPWNSETPFPVTLHLVPRNIVIGIGCKRGTPCEVIESHVSKALRLAGIDAEGICATATIDLKADEAGLLEYCEKHGLKLHTYTAAELMEVQGDFSRSEFVLTQTGADNVCERSAVKYSGGTLVLRKTAENGVTVAAAEIPIKLDFERKLL